MSENPSYFPPVTRPTRPILPGRLSSWDSLDDRVRVSPLDLDHVAGTNPNLPLDTFERLADGTYRRVGSVGDIQRTPRMEGTPVAATPTHRIGWRTVLQVFGVCVAMCTACIAAYNLYSRTHSKSAPEPT